ncbi:unnamed protein product [Cladocopium goreaui]|uniref:PPPDE domain-containing protein n=1 Tax=Cladocopium goreaui TaxID=2562237 RepID=A0A9P1CBC0_9DINO|nr:unnamed protein product [Cladocopium goreaui]
MAASRGYALLLPSRVLSEPETLESARAGQKPRGSSSGAPVTLHVYSVSGSQTVCKVNRFLSHLRTGAYHTAVEVHGKEWSYGYADKGSGVFCCPPKECDAHTYLYSLPMGHTQLLEQTVLALIGRMAKEWQGDDYDILRCNCCHFSHELLRRLGLGPLPKQFMSLASAGAALGDKAQAMSSIRSSLVEVTKSQRISSSSSNAAAVFR